MRSPQAVSKLPRSKARFTLLFLALLGTEAAMELPAEAAPRSAAPSPGVLALQRQDYATAQRLLEEEYLRTHDAELLLKLGDAALGLGQKWLAASLYLNHQRQSEDPSQASPQRLAALHSATEQSAIRIFVVYQTLSQARLTLRIGGRVVGSLPLDGWIVVPPGKVVMAIEGGGAVHSFQPEELRPGQAPRTIVLTDFGPPIVSTGVTVALLGSLPARTSLSPVLEAALVSGIESNLVVVLPPTDKSYLTPPRDLAETTAVVEARRRALRDSGASYLLDAQLTQEGPSWQGRLSVYHQGAEQLAASVDWVCSGCRDAELRTKLQEKAKEVMSQALGRQVISVGIDSEPSGATVQVHKQPRGNTPLRTTLLDGVQHLSIRKPGYLPIDESRTLAPETTQPAALTQLRYQLVVDPLAVRERRLALAKWSLLGVGVAALAVGATLLAVDGLQRCGDPVLESSRTCPSQLSTSPWSFASLAISGAALVTAPILFGFQRKLQKQQLERPLPSP